MVALKNSGVWEALGDGAGGYEDTLGNSFPPFAFNSGMDCDEVSYQECVELGLLEEGEEVEGADIDPEDLFDLESRRIVLGALQAWNEEDHPRDAAGRFTSGGGGQIMESKFDNIHGRPVTAIIRRLTKDGFTKEQIRRVFNSYGMPVSDSTIAIQMREARLGTREDAPFTDQEREDLNKRSMSDAPRPPEPPRPPKEPKEPKGPKEEKREPEPEGDLHRAPPLMREDVVKALQGRARYHDASMSDVEKFNKTIDEGTRNFTEKALGRLQENTSFVRYAPHGEEFNRQYGDEAGSRMALAFYKTSNGMICSSAPSDHSSMAHEMAHAIDRQVGSRTTWSPWKYSGSSAWRKAWKSDRDANGGARSAGSWDRPGSPGYNTHNKLWNYGFTDYQEGFAVSVETAHSHGYATLQRKAPAMAKLLKDWDLIKTT